MGSGPSVKRTSVGTQVSLQNGGQNKSDQSDRDERFIVREEIQRHCAHRSEVLQPDKEDFLLSAIPLVSIDVSSLRRLAQIHNIGANLDRNERVGQMKIISDQEKAAIQQLIVEQKRLLDATQRSVQVAAKKVETMGIEQLRTLNLQVYSTARTLDEKEGCENSPNRQIFR
ncbi:unnamed protein product [Rotaria socialis]|uniref:Uncharacterized protein n=1 Tax=Rotaria socialis TaxID=392032 RepID=A0A820YG64_9BILA|nr:unnamed protein product [Rotaria socialis]